MTHREAINEAMGHVMWTRRHLLPLRVHSEVADSALDSLQTCMDELQEALRPSPWPEAGKLIRALMTTLREVARRITSIEDAGAAQAHAEISDAIKSLEADGIEWARIN